MVRDGETVICNLQVAGVSNPKASLNHQTGPTSHVVHPNGASMGHISVISIGWNQFGTSKLTIIYHHNGHGNEEGKGVETILNPPVSA